MIASAFLAIELHQNGLILRIDVLCYDFEIKSCANTIPDERLFAITLWFGEHHKSRTESSFERGKTGGNATAPRTSRGFKPNSCLKARLKLEVNRARFHGGHFA